MSRSTYQTGYFCTHEDHDRPLFVGEYYKDWTLHFKKEHVEKPSDDGVKQEIAEALERAHIKEVGGIHSPYHAAKIAYDVMKDYFDIPEETDREPERSINLYDEFYADTGWTYSRLEEEVERAQDKLLERNLPGHPMFVDPKLYRELLTMVLPKLYPGAMYRGHTE